MIQKIKKTLFSVNPSEYPDIEVEFTKYDTAEELAEQATVGSAIYAKKTAHVKARLAKEGEIVDTRPRLTYEGKVYTFSEVKRTASEYTQKQRKLNGEVVLDENGSPVVDTLRNYIVTNPDGEEYIVTEDQMNKRYDFVGTTAEGVYECASKGNVETFKQVGQNCCVEKWSSIVYVTKGGYFNVGGNYPITDCAFNGTYSEVSNEPKHNLTD